MKKQIRIKVVVQAKKEIVPGWPHINFGYERETEKIMAIVGAYNPDAEFDVFRYSSKDEAAAVYEGDCAIYDGVLVLLMTNWIRLDEFYARRSKDGLPCAVADVPFCGSGSALSGTSPMIRNEKLPVPLEASTDYNDIARLARTLVVNAKLAQTTVLVVKNDVENETESAAEKRFGIKFINKTAADLMNVFDSVDEKKAVSVAEKWTGGAVKTVEPSQADIIESAKIYLAIKKMMKETGADAVTIACLELSYNDVYGKSRHMYPCLSHFQMADDGELGVCEADIDSTVSSLLTLYLTGKHGFVSDPVVDTSSDEIIYAHCVACRKVFGVSSSKICDYYIRSHAEDQLGASVQVIFPAGEKLTTINMSNSDNWACIHSSVSVGNAGGDAGCRSKLVASCNARALLENWMPMWHRVTVFGDYRQDFINFFRLKGLDIFEEDK
ncbi:MAG: hypothetical protein EGQ30_01670 [Clostridiales bacterium]|nr:hypothetical protein [Clostridiales bacterium]